MYCSGCGLALAPGQAVCPKCGRPAMAPVSPVPGMEFQLQSYAGKVKALGVVWLIYSGIALLTGIVALAFANAILSGHFGPWASEHLIHGPFMHGPFMPFFAPAMLRFAWIFIFLRVGLAAVAGWGLLERAQWGRIVAIVAACLSLLKFPFGTAMGIWTLVMLLGYRNSTLYEQL